MKSLCLTTDENKVFIIENEKVKRSYLRLYNPKTDSFKVYCNPYFNSTELIETNINCEKLIDLIDLKAYDDVNYGGTF